MTSESRRSPVATVDERGSTGISTSDVSTENRSGDVCGDREQADAEDSPGERFEGTVLPILDAPPPSWMLNNQSNSTTRPCISLFGSSVTAPFRGRGSHFLPMINSLHNGMLISKKTWEIQKRYKPASRGKAYDRKTRTERTRYARNNPYLVNRPGQSAFRMSAPPPVHNSRASSSRNYRRRGNAST